MVMLLTALSVGVIMVTPVSGGLCYDHTKCTLLPYKACFIAIQSVLYCHTKRALLPYKACFIAIQRTIKHSLVANSTLWLENKAHCAML